MPKNSPADKKKTRIKNRLRSLEEIFAVTVEVNGDNIIRILHKQKYVAKMEFKWLENSHYVGYFIFDEGSKSKAIVSLWTPLQAAKFVTLYATLIELRAKRRNGD